MLPLWFFFSRASAPSGLASRRSAAVNTLMPSTGREPTSLLGPSSPYSKISSSSRRTAQKSCPDTHSPGRFARCEQPNARYLPLLPVAPPLPLRCPPLLPVGSVRGVQSVQPDVMTKCENTVLLETQEPCGSVRKCNGDTATDDRNVQGKCHIWFQKMFHVLTLLRSGHTPSQWCLSCNMGGSIPNRCDHNSDKSCLPVPISRASRHAVGGRWRVAEWMRTALEWW